MATRKEGKPIWQRDELTAAVLTAVISMQAEHLVCAIGTHVRGCGSGMRTCIVMEMLMMGFLRAPL
jgi:hypothetical protein